MLQLLRLAQSPNEFRILHTKSQSQCTKMCYLTRTNVVATSVMQSNMNELALFATRIKLKILLRKQPSMNNKIIIIIIIIGEIIVFSLFLLLETTRGCVHSFEQ